MSSSSVPSTAMLLAGAVVLAACAPVLHVDVPPPRGEFPVGRTTLVLVDSSRADPWGATNERTIVVKAWYPAESISGVRGAKYLPHAAELPGRFERGERFIASHLASHAYDTPAIARRSPTYPVLLFSPGNDISPDFYSGYLVELASHGFVVLALDHSYEGKGQVLPDGRRLPVEVDRERPPPTPRAIFDYYRTRSDLRAADGSSVLTALASHPPPSPVTGHLDLSRVGAFGHSIGGVAASQMCRHDARVRACANLDGLVNAKPLLAEHDSYALAQPFLYLGKPLPFKNPAVNDSARRELEAVIAAGNGGGYDVILDDVTHNTFSDYPFFTPTVHPTRKRADLEIVRDVTLAFFDKALLGRPAPLLDDSTAVREARLHVRRLEPAHRP